MTSAPFGQRPAGAFTRAARLLAAIAAIALAVLAAWYFTRPQRGTGAAAMPDSMQMGAAPEARSVHLSGADQQRIGVTFATAEIGPLQREIRTVAQVVYDESRVTAVSLKVDGWVERLDVSAPGDAVRKGDRLFSIYSPMLVTAQQELLLAHHLAADAANGSASTRTGADDLIAAATRRLLQWDVPQGEIDAMLRDGAPHRTLPILSQVAGVVIDKNVLQGQKVMAGETLYRIADLGRVWLDGEVYGPDMGAVHVGQEITAEFPSLPGGTRQGRISFIYPTLDTETRTTHVRVELANPGLLLKPGMYATIRFRSARSGVLTVPRSAVLTTGERSLVFVRDTDGRFVARDVSLGEATDERIEILGGLKAGEVVVASGTFLVDAESNLDKAFGGMGNMPGMDVKAAPPAAGRGSKP